MKISEITVEDSENRKKRSLNIDLESEDVYVTPEKNSLDIFREKVIDVSKEDFYLDTESLEYYDDELLNEKMKNYLDNVDYDNSAIITSKKPISVDDSTNANKRPLDDDLVFEVANVTSACQSKYRKFRTVIDLTDDFNPREYIEEVQCVVEVIDLSK